MCQFKKWYERLNWATECPRSLVNGHAIMPAATVVSLRDILLLPFWNTLCYLITNIRWFDYIVFQKSCLRAHILFISGSRRDCMPADKTSGTVCSLVQSLVPIPKLTNLITSFRWKLYRLNQFPSLTRFRFKIKFFLMVFFSRTLLWGKKSIDHLLGKFTWQCFFFAKCMRIQV